MHALLVKPTYEYLSNNKPHAWYSLHPKESNILHTDYSMNAYIIHTHIHVLLVAVPEFAHPSPSQYHMVHGGGWESYEIWLGTAKFPAWGGLVLHSSPDTAVQDKAVVGGTEVDRHLGKGEKQ